MSIQEKWELPYVVMLHQYDFLSTGGPPSSPTPTTPHETAAEDPALHPNIHETWSFSHPLPPAILEQARQRGGGQIDAGGFQGGNGSNEHNVRRTPPGGLSFPIPHRGTVHGLAGYFETVLYASPSSSSQPTTTSNSDTSKTKLDDWKQTRKVELSTNPLTMAHKSPDMISWFPIFFPFHTPLYIPDNGGLEVQMWRGTDDRGVWYEWCGEVFEGGGGRAGGGKERRRRRRKVGGSGLHSSRGNMCLM
ncbi:hypothetical protein KC353_g18626 [Hortaea werneckii]|nr:hypothetical protein KC353_g18626 [Hortaea werneckii]